MKSFVRIGLLVAVMTGLLVIGLVAGRVLDQQAQAKEYQIGTVIAGVEVGGMTLAEAQSEIDMIAEQRRNQQVVSIYLYDSLVELPEEALNLSVPTVSSNAVEESEQIEATIDITALTEAVNQIESADLSGLVDISTLKNDIEFQLNEEPTKAPTVHLASYIEGINEERTVLANVYAPYMESTILGTWSTGLDGVVIEPRSHFSLKTALEQTNQMVVGGESLDLFSSVIYQALAKSNLELIEHHTPEKLPQSIKVGYGASVNEDHRDLVFYNPNYESMELNVQFSTEGLIVELVGTPYIQEYELVVENTETIQPRTEVTYSKKRRAGNSQVIVNGKNGYAASLFKRELNANKQEVNKVLIARNYIAATSTIEERSVYAKPEPEPELEINDADLQPVIVELPESVKEESQADRASEPQIQEQEEQSTSAEQNNQNGEAQQDFIKGVHEPADKEQDDEN
ncbi:VanW family protein [Alkalicoccobacillus porphyridii]|nr:VanW family protein [Alkalicoccobacillus porphyridii]